MLFTQISFNTFAADNLSKCKKNLVINCNETNLQLFSYQLEIFKHSIIEEYNLKEEVDKLALEKSILQYTDSINEIRKCQQSLNLNLSQCKFEISQQKPVGATVSSVTILFEVRTLDKKCIAENNELKYEYLINHLGEKIAYRQNNIWMPGNSSISCISNDTNQTKTDRVINFGGPTERKSAFILATDWTEDYKVSAHWGKRVSMKKSTLSYEETELGLIFNWSNGANIIIDKKTGLIIHSNILSPESINSETCKTKTKWYRGKRFYPDLKLQEPFKSLRISTLKK